MDTANGRRILALIPCLNEGATVGRIINQTKRYVDQVLVIDDGSTDDTVKKAQKAGATVISHRRNRGKSGAIKTGFQYALANGYNYVVTLDGDGQHNPAEIPTVLDNVMNNGHDISIGYRVGYTTEMPKWRKVGKRILDYVTSFGNGGHLTDSQCGFRAFNRKAVAQLVNQLNGSAFTVESEQLIRGHEHGLAMGNAKISCKYEGLDTSTKNPASHGMSVLSYVIWLVAAKRPLLCIGVPGFIMLLLGIYFGIRTLQIYNQTSVFPISYAILVSILLIIGVLALFIAVLLNVLPHIVRRVKNEIDENNTR